MNSTNEIRMEIEKIIRNQSEIPQSEIQEIVKKVFDRYEMESEDFTRDLKRTISTFDIVRLMKDTIEKGRHKSREEIVDFFEARNNKKEEEVIYGVNRIENRNEYHGKEYDKLGESIQDKKKNQIDVGRIIESVKEKFEAMRRDFIREVEARDCYLSRQKIEDLNAMSANTRAGMNKKEIEMNEILNSQDKITSEKIVEFLKENQKELVVKANGNNLSLGEIAEIEFRKGLEALGNQEEALRLYETKKAKDKEEKEEVKKSPNALPDNIL